MPDGVPVGLPVVDMIRRAALERGVRDEAVPAALEEMGRDVFPGADWFAACFSGGVPPGSGPRGWRSIGDAFWRGSGATREERRLDGSFYTPDAVIDHILRLIWKDIHSPSGKPVGTLCDPAVGCGYFLLRLLDRLKKRHGLDAARRWAADSLFGVDKDPAAVFMTRVLVWIALSDKREEFRPNPGHIRQGDSLLGPPFGRGEGSGEDAPAAGLDWREAFPGIARAGGFDCVVGNPPYEVLTNFSRHPERRALAQSIRGSGWYRDSLSGQINLYRCFIERSLDLLRPGGSLSFVVPLSLARDGAALPLRRRLLEEEGAGEWRLFGERDAALGGVTQSACIFRARRGAGRARRLAVSAMGERSVATLAELRRNGGGSYAVPMLDRAGLALWRWMWKHVPGRLDAAADMRVGEVDQTVFRDCMRDRDTGCVLARGTHLAPFVLDVAPRAGKERFLDLDMFLRKKGGAAEACRERAGSLRVAQMGIRNMETSPRLVAALLPPGVYAGNSLNVYAPVGGVRAEFLAGMLNSRLLDWLFRAGSGNNNINLAEMRSLPFPARADDALAAAVASAYRECAAVAEKGGDVGAARARLDAAAEACCGVPRELTDGVLYASAL